MRLPRPPVPEGNKAVRDRLFAALGAAFSAWALHLARLDRSPAGAWVVGLILAAAWTCAVLFLLQDTRLRRFWIAWAAVAGALAFVPPQRQMSGLSVLLFLVFLLARKFRPVRRLTPRQMTAAFASGVGLFLLVTAGWFRTGAVRMTAAGVPLSGPAAPLEGAAAGLTRASLWSLRFFLLILVLRLFFRTRLHHLRIKPKLAISAVLLAAVPLALLLGMGLILLFSVLGESRAVRARSVLGEWAELAARDGGALGHLSDRAFPLLAAAPKGPPGTPAPAWAAELLAALRADAAALSRSAPSGARADYVWRDGGLWLVRWDPSAPAGTAAGAAFVGPAWLDRLAALVAADIQVSSRNPVSLEGFGERVREGVRGRSASATFTPGTEPLAGSVARPAGPPRSGWLERPAYFGMVDFPVLAFDASGFREFPLLLILRASPAEVFRDIYSVRNPMGVAVLAGLLAAGLLLLLLEAAGVVFGLRIVGGITSALAALRQGTRRVAEGRFDEPIRIPNEDELGELAAAFNDMAVAVEKGRAEAVAREKLERELKVAREIQERLLPHDMPRVAGFEIAGVSLPSLQVSGDYFDFLDTADGRLAVAVADVSGKGIPAALLMASLQAGWRGQAAAGDTAAAVARINDLLARSTDAHMFATFFCGVLDRVTGAFGYANAGHNPPALVRAGGEVERLGPSGLLLGFIAGQAYVERTVVIRPGDALVMFTDGIPESRKAGGRPGDEDLFFGEERLIEAVRARSAEGAAGIQEGILAAVREFTGGEPPADDITLVVVKRKPA